MILVRCTAATVTDFESYPAGRHGFMPAPLAGFLAPQLLAGWAPKAYA